MVVTVCGSNLGGYNTVKNVLKPLSLRAFPPMQVRMLSSLFFHVVLENPQAFALVSIISLRKQTLFLCSL